MHVRLKVCCIASRAEADMAIAAGADALGLVAHMPSGPGPISDEEIAEIAAAVPPPIATFLLTSESRSEEIAAHVERTGVNTIQIVSQISAEEVARLAGLCPNVRRVQVIHVEDRSALDLITDYAPHVHAFLLDSGRPSAAVPELGGTGRSHDWAVSAEFVEQSPRPVFLAGGLKPGNVGEAVRQVCPFGVDLCTGVRTDDGLDAEKLNAFVAALRAPQP
ncbi:MAG: phosphoribosylanthranilate isomerase [Pseudomonadota bacterium]